MSRHTSEGNHDPVSCDACQEAEPYGTMNVCGKRSEREIFDGLGYPKPPERLEVHPERNPMGECLIRPIGSDRCIAVARDSGEAAELVRRYNAFVEHIPPCFGDTDGHDELVTCLACTTNTTRGKRLADLERRNKTLVGACEAALTALGMAWSRHLDAFASSERDTLARATNAIHAALPSLAAEPKASDK